MNEARTEESFACFSQTFPSRIRYKSVPRSSWRAVCIDTPSNSTWNVMKNIYLKLSGPDLKGESLDKDHAQWIELTGFHHEVRQPASGAVSTAGGHTVGRTEHGDLALVKDLDMASPAIFLAVSGGTTFQSAQVDFYRAAGDGKRVKYLEIQLKNVLISQVALGIDGGQGGMTQGAWSLTKNDKTFAV
jgi:type VI secretion system secreted protein Hcp